MRRMIKLDNSKTTHRGTGRGRKEVHEAESADGIWLFEHTDSTGTPWTIVHKPTGRRLIDYATSLDGARNLALTGHALAQMDRDQATSEQAA